MDRALRRGTVEYVWVVLAEASGVDLTDVAVQLADLPAGQRPSEGDWKTAAATTVPGPGRLRAAVLASPVAAGQRRVWVRIPDTPERTVLLAGGYVVV